MTLASLYPFQTSPLILAIGFSIVLVASLVAAEEIERRGSPAATDATR